MIFLQRATIGTSFDVRWSLVAQAIPENKLFLSKCQSSGIANSLCTFCLEILHTEPQQGKRSNSRFGENFAFMSVPVSTFDVRGCAQSQHAVQLGMKAEQFSVIQLCIY